MILDQFHSYTLQSESIPVWNKYNEIYYLFTKLYKNAHQSTMNVIKNNEYFILLLH